MIREFCSILSFLILFNKVTSISVNSCPKIECTMDKGVELEKGTCLKWENGSYSMDDCSIPWYICPLTKAINALNNPGEDVICVREDYHEDFFTNVQKTQGFYKDCKQWTENECAEWSQYYGVTPDDQLLLPCASTTGPHLDINETNFNFTCAKDNFGNQSECGCTFGKNSKFNGQCALLQGDTYHGICDFLTVECEYYSDNKKDTIEYKWEAAETYVAWAYKHNIAGPLVDCFFDTFEYMPQYVREMNGFVYSLSALIIFAFI